MWRAGPPWRLRRCKGANRRQDGKNESLLCFYRNHLEKSFKQQKDKLTFKHRKRRLQTVIHFSFFFCLRLYCVRMWTLSLGEKTIFQRCFCSFLPAQLCVSMTTALLLVHDGRSAHKRFVCEADCDHDVPYYVFHHGVLNITDPESVLHKNTLSLRDSLSVGGEQIKGNVTDGFYPPAWWLTSHKAH